MNFRTVLKLLSIKILLAKIAAFLIPWSLALWAVVVYSPWLIDWTKLVTTVFSNSLVFLLAYILTVLGFRYSSKEHKKDDKKD